MSGRTLRVSVLVSAPTVCRPEALKPDPEKWIEVHSDSAFSLIEVMVAMALFFMAVFAILGVTSQNLAAAARLQRHPVDIAGLAAVLSLTNRLEEGVEMGDFGDLFPGARWTRTITEVHSNGFYRVDFLVVSPPPNRRSRAPVVEDTLSILLYRPNSGAPQRSGGMPRP